MENLRVCRLLEYVKGLRDNHDGKELYARYKDDIESVEPQEVFEIFKSLLDQGNYPKDILIFLDKVINAFYVSLSNYRWEYPVNDNFLKDMLLENQDLVKKTDEIKAFMKEDNLSMKKEKILQKVDELENFNVHYLKKENILFPYMEKKEEKFEGLSIMWSLHDAVRAQIRHAQSVLEDDGSSDREVNTAIANLFFGILGVKKKEELILFPAASRILDENDWYNIHRQSLEYMPPFEGKTEKNNSDVENNGDGFINGVFKTETGELAFEEILMMLGSLPVDLTFVDEYNKVKFFTKPKDRIFPRSAAIIGRNVKNCHPPESVHIVEEIVESFRSGRENTAKFWIDLKGKMILIQYFALTDSMGNYKGVLEVSQDITEIKSLNGERRLLKWEGSK